MEMCSRFGPNPLLVCGCAYERTYQLQQWTMEQVFNYLISVDIYKTLFAFQLLFDCHSVMQL